MSKHEFTDGERLRGGKARKSPSGGYWGEITKKDCALVDAGWHRFWVKRGGIPKTRDSLVFGARGRPRIRS